MFLNFHNLVVLSSLYFLSLSNLSPSLLTILPDSTHLNESNFGFNIIIIVKFFYSYS